MKKTLLSIIAILTLVILVTSCAPIQTSSNAPQIRTLNVSGTGTVELEPDIARVNIGVRSQSEDIAEALDDNSAKANAIMQTLVDLGVAEKDIQTSNFNIYPQQTQPALPEEESQQTFVVENTVSVVVRQLDSLGEVLSAVVREGANTISGVTFNIEDPEAAAAEARQLAIEDAQAQAEAIAEAAGVKLGAVQSININDGSSIPIARDSMVIELAVGGSVPISGGTLTIQVTANLTYEIN
jgi:hypothetical protein